VRFLFNYGMNLSYYIYDMQSFRQFITEVGTTPHEVGEGNKHGIKKHTYVGDETTGDKWGHGKNAHHTTFHFPHPDGKRHVSMKFEGQHEGDGKEPKYQEVTYGIHDSEPAIQKGKRIHAGRMSTSSYSSKPTKPHHAAKIHSKVHSIMKHHMKHTKADEIRWTSEKDDSHMEKDDYGTGNLGRRTKIYKRQVKRSLKDHPDWEYHDNSEEGKEHESGHTTHLLRRKKK